MKQNITTKILLLSFILSINFSAFSQNSKSTNSLSDYKEMASQPGANFYTIVNQKRAEFNKMDLDIKANYKAFKQFERWAYIWADRINHDGSFPSADQVIEKNNLLQLLAPNQTVTRSASSGCGGGASTWTQVGPVNNPTQNGYASYPGKGRVNVVKRDPNNSQIIYVGSAAGGIWKSTDGGSTWAPKSDMLAGLGVTDILIDTSNTSIIYMATGDADAKHVSSIGLFKSTDGGNTWNPTGLTFTLNQNEYIRDIAFAPGSVTKIFALTNTEIKVSTNSGTSFSNVTVTYPFGAFNENFKDIIFDPNDANKVIVSDSWGALYISTNGGTSFAMHNTIQGGNQQDILRIVATPANNNEFYALTQSGVFKRYTFNMAGTAADELSSSTIAGFSSQGGYNQCFSVSPTNKNNVMVGGVRGYKSINEGTSFSVMLNPYNNPAGVGFYVHPDHHYMAFNATGDSIINGHDGGVHIGAFASTTGWTDLSNGLIITQPYNVAITQKVNTDDFMMANQDNDGFSKVLKSGTRQWVSALAGDGTSTGIDISDSSIRYLGGTKGQLYRTNDGYASGYSSHTTILSSDNNAAFVSPLELHPTAPATIYAGHDDVKKSTDRGATWTSLNSGLTGVKFLDITENGTSIRILAIGGNGTAKMSLDDGATWSTLTPPTGKTFNSFSVKPSNGWIFATTSGYGTTHNVSLSTNNGSSWIDANSNLPNIIMKKILYKHSTSANDSLYLATELGLYFRPANVATWAKLGTNLPNVIVTDIEFNYAADELFIGTFGRGMWKYNLKGGSPDVTAPVADITTLPALTGQCSITSLTAPTATDNCAGAVTGTTTTTTPITANTTITWTYTDGTNTSTQTQAVTLNDNTAPVADVASLPALTGQCSVTSLTAPTATDNCAGAVTGTTTTTTPITASTTITWTYTDGANTSTQTQAVTINDNIAPVANVASLPALTSQCSITSLTAPTATDNCAGAVTATTTTTTPITTSTTITWTYTDGANTSTQTQAVTINDNTAPVANVASLPALTGQCSVTSLTAPTATDNCAGAVTGTTTTTTPITASTMITWTYTDGANTSTQTQMVTINDNTAPVADVASLPAVTGQCSVTSLTAPTATDNCAGAVTGTTTTTTPITASTMITWTYTDGANTSTQTQMVTINDITAPVANVASLPAVTGQCSVTSLTPPTATDNCAGVVTGTTTTTLPITANTTVTWTYTDGTNTSTQTQMITLNDNTAPVADVASLPAVTSQCSVTSLTPPTATDNCAGAITGTTTATLPITANTTITWTYTDGANTSTQTQAITINDVTAPVANAASLPALTGTCSLTSLASPTATDNCAGTITGTTTTTLPITTSTTITWTYTDGTNTSSQTQVVTITDVTAPVADATTLPALSAICNLTALTAPTATDNCAGTVTGTTTTSLPITANTTITWNYTDGTNTSSQTQNVVITPLYTSVSQSGFTLTTNFVTGYTYQWVDCNNGFSPLAGETSRMFTATTNGSYAVVITSNGCSDTSSCFTFNSVSLKDKSSAYANVKIYPNPTSGEFYIDFGRNEEEVNIVVRNTIQQIISVSGHSNIKRVKLETGISTGIYFVEVSSANGERAIFKVVKN